MEQDEVVDGGRIGDNQHLEPKLTVGFTILTGCEFYTPQNRLKLMSV
jgi:hypothetical protein